MTATSVSDGGVHAAPPAPAKDATTAERLTSAGSPAPPSVLVITCLGTPVPQGSHKAFVVGKKGGPQRAIVTDDNSRTKPWKQTVKHAALAAMALDGWAMTHGPVSVTVTFYLPRPKGHYGTGRNAHLLKPSAPDYPTTKPDGDKLVRSLFDALGEAGVWKDDAQVVNHEACKAYAGYGRPPGARAEVRVMSS